MKDVNYSDLLKKHGFSYKSLDWGSRTSQYRRFDILAGIADLGGCSVLDVGCGLCDFHNYLGEKDIRADYHGIDATEDMITASKQRYPDLDLQVGDALTLPASAQYDYIVSSGIFTFFRDEDTLMQAVAAMFKGARKGLAFNALSGWAENKEEDELTPDPARLATRCSKLTQRLVMRHDYMPHDFTIYLYKEQ